MSKILKAYRLEEETVKKIENLAKKSKRTPSDVARLIIEGYFKQNEIMLK